MFENPTLGDRDYITDALSSQKLISGTYNTFASECTNKMLEEQFISILKEEHDIGYELFSEMLTRGWYSVPPAEQQKIDDAKTKFANML